MVAEGPVVVIRSAHEIKALTPADVKGMVVVLDYAAVDRSVLGTSDACPSPGDWRRRGRLGLSGHPLFERAGREPRRLHRGWQRLHPGGGRAAAPRLYARLEDLAQAGIESLDDLARIEAARLTWDADVFSPGNSGNLVAPFPAPTPPRP